MREGVLMIGVDRIGADHFGRWIHVRHAPRLATFRIWLSRAALAFAFLLVFRVAFLATFRVTTQSMEPTLRPGDLLVVDKQIFEWRLPRRWEIIVFHGPEYRSTPYVKRVVGMPGETVEIRSGSLFINGEKMELPFAAVYQAHGRHGVKTPCRLDDDEYFLLGDHSEVSDDSRTWPKAGVKLPAIIGLSIR